MAESFPNPGVLMLNYIYILGCPLDLLKAVASVSMCSDLYRVVKCRLLSCDVGHMPVTEGWPLYSGLFIYLLKPIYILKLIYLLNLYVSTEAFISTEAT